MKEQSSLPSPMEREFHQIATEEHRTKSELFREMFRVYRSYRKRQPEPEIDDAWVIQVIREAKEEQRQNPSKEVGIDVEDEEVINRIIHEERARWGRKTGLRVVLDTNVYISAFHFPEGVCARLVEYAAERYYELIISPVIIREFAGASRRGFQVNEDKHLRFIKFLGGKPEASLSLGPSQMLSRKTRLTTTSLPVLSLATRTSSSLTTSICCDSERLRRSAVDIGMDRFYDGRRVPAEDPPAPSALSRARGFQPLVRGT
jgi:hypothetical protein